jgi:hypothetical protein
VLLDFIKVRACVVLVLLNAYVVDLLLLVGVLVAFRLILLLIVIVLLIWVLLIFHVIANVMHFIVITHILRTLCIHKTLLHLRLLNPFLNQIKGFISRHSSSRLLWSALL